MFPLSSARRFPAGLFFDLLFSSTEISKFAEKDKIEYLNDMTTERDLKNQISFAHDKGREEGRDEGREEERLILTKKCKAKGLAVDVIIDLTGLSAEEIQML